MDNKLTLDLNEVAKIYYRLFDRKEAPYGKLDLVIVTYANCDQDLGILKKTEEKVLIYSLEQDPTKFLQLLIGWETYELLTPSLCKKGLEKFNMVGKQEIVIKELEEFLKDKEIIVKTGLNKW